jgi:hypothetical protein
MTNWVANPYTGIAVGLLVALLALQVVLHPGDREADAGANGWAMGLNVAIIPLAIVFLMIVGTTFGSLIRGPR